MTAPTTLAETIARLRASLAMLNPDSSRDAQHREDLEAAISCARRCEAIDRVGGKVAAGLLRMSSGATGEPTLADAEVSILHAAIEDRVQLQTRGDRWEAKYLDAASERDALAKRVGELEAENARLVYNAEGDERSKQSAIDHAAKLEAESTRLRTENERLAATLEQTRDDGEGTWREWRDRYNQRLTDLTAAQDRVRELTARTRPHDQLAKAAGCQCARCALIE